MGRGGVGAQSVTQILVAPLKLGPITAVTHHCCWAFTLMMTMMTTMTMMTMITMMPMITTMPMMTIMTMMTMVKVGPITAL